MYHIMMTQDVIYLRLFEDFGIQHLVPIRHLDIPHLLFWIYRYNITILHIRTQCLTNPTGYGTNKEVGKMRA